MQEKIKKINITNLIVVCIIFFMELSPNSIMITSDGGLNNKVNIEYVSYFTEPNLWLNMVPLIPFIIAVFTICILIVNSVCAIIEDNKKLSIVSIVFSSICGIGSLMYICIMKKYITAYNLVITALFFVSIVLQSIKLGGQKNESQIKNK